MRESKTQKSPVRTAEPRDDHGDRLAFGVRRLQLINRIGIIGFGPAWRVITIYRNFRFQRPGAEISACRVPARSLRRDRVIDELIRRWQEANAENLSHALPLAAV